MDNQAPPTAYCCDTAADPRPLWRQRLERRWRDGRHAIRLRLFVAWYRVLFALGLGWAYNRLLCRLGVYYQYQRGVCGWCGRPHVKPRGRNFTL